MKKKVFLYIRKATAEEPNSVQYEKLKRYCAENGLQIAGAFVDIGRSGMDLNRPELQHLISRLEQRGNQVMEVIFTDWSRLTRNPHHAELILERLARVGVKAYPIEENKLSLASLSVILFNRVSPFNDLFDVICPN